MSHKKQHFVPATYLRAWCDAAAPAAYKPYVWLFPKNGGEGKRKSPDKIFSETDFYSIKKVNGERDLVLEKGLAQLESKFSALRDKKISKRKFLNAEEKGIICTFTAAMYARTKARRTHLKEQWQQVLDMGNRVSEWMKNASPEEARRLSSALGPPRDEATSMTLSEIEYVVENNIQSALQAEIRTLAPALARMQFVILDTLKNPVFITSDNPCIWLDLEEFKKPSPLGTGGLVSPSIEISLPLSPTQCVFFGKKLLANNFYIPIQLTNPLIATLNNRTWAYSDEFFISHQENVNMSWLL